MPRHATHRLEWSAVVEAYELHDGESVHTLPADGCAWVEWLSEVSSFAFSSRLGGHCTIRKEKMQRGGSYWYAYRSLHGRTVKRYIGRATELTSAHLEQVAAAFNAQLASTGGALTAPEPTLAPSQSSPLATLLDTKLYPPRLPSLPIERPRQLDQLDVGYAQKVTLLTAPAGFGKTTLVRQWLNTRHASTPVAWISLDSGDNDPVRFWRYMIVACQRLQPALGQAALDLLSASPQSPFETPSLNTIVTMLLNELARLDEDGLLILDDYAVIEETYIHTLLTTFLEHLPATLHVLILSRSEPPLPLARWRAKGELTDLYSADLRFSRAEIAAFLAQALPYSCSAEALQHLETHLEGWAAGLRLLTLALRNKHTAREAEQYIFTMTGSQHSFQGYFVNEILALQPESLQSFLLQTSILSRLSGQLCTALTGREESADLLQAMGRAGLFVEELDYSEGEERWYRYYTLFAEAMQGEAQSRLGEQTLHNLAHKASLWFEQHGMLAEAIEAALRSQNSEHAADLIERIVQSQLPDRPGEYFVINEFHTLCRWLAQLPEDILQRHPALCFSYANALLYTFVLDEIPFTATTLLRIKQCLSMAQEGWQRAGETARLGEVLAYCAMLARQYGAINESVNLANEALTYLPDELSMWRLICFSVLGMHVFLSGHLNLARQLFLPRPIPTQAPTKRSFRRPGIITFARICREQVALHEAEAHLRPVLVEARSDEDRDDIADAQLELARLSYAWNKLTDAEQQAQEALTLSSQINVMETSVRAALVLVDIQHAHGDTVQALQRLTEILTWVQPDSFPLYSMLFCETLTRRARLHLALGNLAAVESWIEGRTQYLDLLPPLQQEKEELIVVRLLLGQGRYDEALTQLSPALQEAQAEGRIGSALEQRLLMAQAYNGRKQMREAKALLQEVLLHAYPEGYLRLFVDEGEGMEALLRSLRPEMQSDIQRGFVRDILQIFAGGGSSPAAPTLKEPLSSQEMRVLRLLVAGHSNPEAAAELVVSVNTVKTHLQSIYRKLNVRNRVEASEVARQLHLL